uniref:Chromobox 1 n=1 Tax=Schizaphis graminum TaxID=13262 RepID=A0A2S2P0W1_SCHGA
MPYFTRSHRSGSTTPESRPSSSNSRLHHRPLNENHTAKSADSETVVKGNRPNDTQPPTDAFAAIHAQTSSTMIKGEEQTDNVSHQIQYKVKIENVKEEVADTEYEEYSFDEESIKLNVDPSNVDFDSGLEPENILGITQKDGKFMFLIKWKNQVTADLVEAKLMNERYPQLVIEYYESIYVFTPSKNEN